MIGYQRTIEGILTTFPQDSTKLTDLPHQESQRRSPLTGNLKPIITQISLSGARI